MSWMFRSEQGIGRGEIAESRIEAPLFAAFMAISAVALFIFHVMVQDNSLTMAVAVSLFVFGITVVKVEVGLYILVIAMLLSPEIEAGAVGTHSERGVNLRYDDVLIIVVFIGVIVRLAFEGRMMLWRPNPINSGIFAYYGVCIISTLGALRMNVPAWDSSVAAFVMLKMAEFYMIFFMVGLVVTSRAEMRRQLTVFFIVASMISTYALFTIGSLERVSAPFEAGGTEPNTLGGYLTVVMCAAVGLYFYCPSKKIRWTLVLVIGLAFVPFIETLSRASYMALTCGTITIGILARKGMVLVLIALVLLTTPFTMPEKVQERVAYTFREETGKPLEIAGQETTLYLDTSTHERIYVWGKVRYNLTVWPWFGGGVSWETVLDSQYARVLLETGLFGFAAFLFLMSRIFRTTRESYRWSTDWVAKGLALGMCGAFVALAFHGIGTISFLIVRIMEPFWFLIALTVSGRAWAIQDHQKRIWTARQQQAEAVNMPPQEQAA